MAQSIEQLARCPNVHVKLGGLGMRLFGFDVHTARSRHRPSNSREAWRPYIETCIERSAPRRAMFESNFPVDKGSCSYQSLWNAFKRIAAGASSDEKHALFGGTAMRVYRLAEAARDHEEAAPDLLSPGRRPGRRDATEGLPHRSGGRGGGREG